VLRFGGYTCGTNLYDIECSMNMEAFMAFSSADAAEALRQAERAEQVSHTLRGYQSMAPHLILWGAIYFLAYSFSHFRPAQGGLAWLVLAPLGSVGSFALAWFDKSERGDSDGHWAVVPALFATFLGFIAATALIMQPQDPRQMAAFVPLVVAVAYIVLGLGAGRRIVFAGIALAALTLFGFIALPGWFMLWMAVVGGGTLILSGLWLRRV
jgi:hypothetical protein